MKVVELCVNHFFVELRHTWRGRKEVGINIDGHTKKSAKAELQHLITTEREREREREDRKEAGEEVQSGTNNKMQGDLFRRGQQRKLGEGR